MSEHAVPPHVHSFPACECGQTITSLLDTLSDTMRVQARALAAVQQRVETAERERNEALKIMVSSKLEPCTIHNAFQPGCVSCIVKKAMEADALRADLGRAVKALRQYEWVGQGGIVICEKDEDYCAACTNFKSEGHKPDCWFVAALTHPTPTTAGYTT